jgi:hypothetical protein
MREIRLLVHKFSSVSKLANSEVSHIPPQHVASLTTPRVQIVREIVKNSGHVLIINFLWEAEDGMNTMVRLGQENWHRILNSVKGADFEWFANAWRSHLKRQTDDRSFFEECGICKLEGAENNPESAAANHQEYPVSDRPWNFQHRLCDQPQPGGPGYLIHAD